MTAPHSMTTFGAEPDDPGRLEDGRMVFFEHQSIDQLMGVVLSLAAEVYVLRDRLKATEATLAGHGVLDVAEVDQYRPADGDELKTYQSDRDAFFDRLLEPITSTDD